MILYSRLVGEWVPVCVCVWQGEIAPGGAEETGKAELAPGRQPRASSKDPWRALENSGHIWDWMNMATKWPTASLLSARGCLGHALGMLEDRE